MSLVLQWTRFRAIAIGPSLNRLNCFGISGASDRTSL